MQSKMHRNASVDVLYKQGTDRLCLARVCGLSNFFFRRYSTLFSAAVSQRNSNNITMKLLFYFNMKVFFYFYTHIHPYIVLNIFFTRTLI